MNDQFYTRLIDVESIVIELDQMDLTEKEKHRLAELVDSTLHHTILDAVLNELSAEDKQVFLQLLAKKENDKIWELLDSKVEKIEERIKLAAEEIKKEMHKDLKEARVLHQKHKKGEK